jgi:hypothetical protein
VDEWMLNYYDPAEPFDCGGKKPSKANHAGTDPGFLALLHGFIRPLPA